MKVSGTGAMVGAAVGFAARGAVVLLNFTTGGPLMAVALPSAAIGALVGAIAGATGRPIRGAIVGAILSGVVFEAFMLSCASVIGTFSAEAGPNFLRQTLTIALEMALAGAIAGLCGGAMGATQDDPKTGKPADPI